MTVEMGSIDNFMNVLTSFFLETLSGVQLLKYQSLH